MARRESTSGSVSTLQGGIGGPSWSLSPIRKYRLPGIRVDVLLRIIELVRPFSKLHAVLRTCRIVADRLVYIFFHLRPIKIFANILVQKSLSGVAGQYRVMHEVKYMGSERVWRYYLYDPGLRRVLLSQKAVVTFEEVRVEVL